MQKGIEKVCNLQVEFWTHLTTVVPDLNILNDLGKKLYAASSEADFFWNQLCIINPNYQQALNIYGEYLKEIRNHEHLGNTYIERAFNTMNAKKSIDEHAKTSDVLFSEDTTVLHVSGNKESIGKILKTSQGLSKVFGYSKTEVIGHSVNILMPTLFARKHIDFMERFFRTGRQVIFYQERTLFATHRNGHCFQMKILVKQMPSLAEGIQYVGLIKPISSDYDYMLTDMDGVIDSFSKGITGLLGLTPNLFKDKDSQINIQLLAPDLINFFLETQAKGRAAKSKYRDAGGEILTLIVPRDFHAIAKSEAKSNNRSGSRQRGNRTQQSNNRNRSSIFKQFLKCLSKPRGLQKDRMPTAKQLLQQPEYVNNERRKDVQCEITCLDIKASTNDSMKMLVFKFSKNDKNDKKKIEDIAQIIGNYDDLPDLNKKDTSYNEFKAASIIDESKEDVDLLAHPNLPDSKKKQSLNQDPQQPPLLPLIRPPSSALQLSQNTPSKQFKSSLREVAQPSPIQEQSSPSDKQSSKKSSSKQSKHSKHSKQSKQSKVNVSQSEELKEMDISAIETPRLDISAIKLESAQKEKQSFLEELKKQSFIVSETSTQKMEAKESINIGEKQKEEKKSFDLMQQQRGQGSVASSQQEPDRMVKLAKANNNLNLKLLGDDEEPQEMLKVTEEEEKVSLNSDNDSSSSSHSKSKSNKQGSQSKSKSKSKATSQKEDSAYDSEESEEDYSGDGNSGEVKQSTGRKSGGSASKQSKATSKGSQNERQPLLAPASYHQTSAGRTYIPTAITEAPNLNDFKRGFDEEDKEDQILQIHPKNSSHHSSTKQQQNNSIIRQLNESKAAFKKMELLKRDTVKIKTNPKYKCVDEFSEDEHDVQQKNINDDPQQLSSKELDFRETILKYEKRRKRKERKQKEKEQKKIKALNGEDTPSSLTGSSMEAGVTKGGEDDEVESSSSSSESSEDTKDDDKGNKNKQDKKIAKVTNGGPKKGQKSNNDEGDISSVATRQNKTERNHYILRIAIDEKYIPASIQNLRLAAQFIFLILLLLSITYYVIQNSLFDKINQNIKNIHNSESRLTHIIDISLRTRTLILMNRNYLNLTAAQRDELFNTTIRELRNSATELKNAQADLSLKTALLNSDQLQKINPDDVRMQYKQYPNMPDFYVFRIWEAIMEIVVSAYRISTLPLNEILDDHPTTYFVVQNCLNSVLKALKSSTDAIIEESETNRQFNMQIFLYLLIAASCSLLISLLFLIPVINKVKRNKQEVLELFTHKNIEKHIDDQLKICRNFVSMRLQQENQGPEHDIDGEENGVNVNDKELQNELNNNKYMKRIKKKNKGKKWKKLNTDFGSTLLKFLLFICIIQGYFLANYLLSSQFLREVQDLTQELNLLISRELIYTNGTSLIEGEQSITYVPRYHEQLYDEEEQLLDKFSQNYDYHSTSYNDDFNNIIYSNVCQYVGYDSQQTCESFNQGILKKGIYSSVIKYWDFLRQLNHDFLESSRSNQTIRQFLNEQRLQVAERMQDYYFKVALSKLVSKLEEDIDYYFNIEYIQNRTIFIIYIIYIVILYFLIWRKFVTIMQNELWKTKSMLSILPTKLCFEIEEIRYFIYGNSSNDFLSTKL